MCQSACNFILYNTTTKKSISDCDIQTESIDTLINEEQFSKKKLANEFLKTITNSNFIVLKCFKLAFGTKNFFKNIGRVIMSVIFIFYLISLLFYFINERKKIDMFINIVIDEKVLMNINNNNANGKYEKNKKEENKGEKEKEKENKSKIQKKGKDKHKSKSKNRKKHFPPKKIKENRKLKKVEINSGSTKNLNINSISQLYSNHPKKNININIFPIKEDNINFPKSKKDEILNTVNNFDVKNKKNTNFINYENLNDQELNSLEYNIALDVDKRTYCRCYISLLKKKHLILFTFLPANDYNLYSLKIALFLLSFSLYFTINGFFFTDSTMNKIIENSGNFDLIFQIPQILYSSVISAIINIILKLLSLSEKNILFLKQEADLKKAKNLSSHIRKCITIKFVLFFIISNLLLVFFWYFITCFCAIYINTQIILFKDTIISFGLSMLYPFALNLLPGLFRIPALRDTT